MRLARVLHELAALLEAQRIPYAVVGDLAASARGEARFTRDIDGTHVATATPESMAAMKVLSATAQRPRDHGDLQAILRANPQLDEGRVESLLETIEARGYSRGQNLTRKWQTLRTELAK